MKQVELGSFTSLGCIDDGKDRLIYIDVENYNEIVWDAAGLEYSTQKYTKLVEEFIALGRKVQTRECKVAHNTRAISKAAARINSRHNVTGVEVKLTDPYLQTIFQLYQHIVVLVQHSVVLYVGNKPLYDDFFNMRAYIEAYLVHNKMRLQHRGSMRNFGAKARNGVSIYDRALKHYRRYKHDNI